MSVPIIGEIRCVAFNYAPEGWLLCDGQELQTKQYQGLYALISNKFGGNGKTTFSIPNLNQNSNTTNKIHMICGNINPNNFGKTTDILIPSSYTIPPSRLQIDLENP